MQTSAPTAPKPTMPSDAGAPSKAVQSLLGEVLAWLDEAKATEIVSIEIKNKSSIGDYMVVATGRTDRHVSAIADQVGDKLKSAGVDRVRIQGQPQCDWVLIDAGDIIVHVFRPEVREFYKIEKMWQADRPEDSSTH